MLVSVRRGLTPEPLYCFTPYPPQAGRNATGNRRVSQRMNVLWLGRTAARESRNLRDHGVD